MKLPAMIIIHVTEDEKKQYLNDSMLQADIGDAILTAHTKCIYAGVPVEDVILKVID
jgi:hypothetical protein